jgi:hypothetical protein
VNTRTKEKEEEEWEEADGEGVEELEGEGEERGERRTISPSLQCAERSMLSLTNA